MSRTLLAVSQREDTNNYGACIDSLENNYVEYLEGFGAHLVIIPNCTSDVGAYFDLPIKGIVLTGGNTINPELYGEDACTYRSVSKKRDSVEAALMNIAIEKKIPVFGICRGMQFINIFFGGSLVMDLKKEKGKYGHVAATHTITIIENSCVNCGHNTTFSVNSYHDQGMLCENIADGLRVFAEAEDGVIEGIFHPQYAIAGIQWHPERSFSDSYFDKKIIKTFMFCKAHGKKL
ncbi:MAG: gamma-glutamyl-gamma-aminobutyrate hydrolase family protein [bacterium]